MHIKSLTPQLVYWETAVISVSARLCIQVDLYGGEVVSPTHRSVLHSDCIKSKLESTFWLDIYTRRIEKRLRYLYGNWPRLKITLKKPENLELCWNSERCLPNLNKVLRNRALSLETRKKKCWIAVFSFLVQLGCCFCYVFWKYL